MNLRPLLPWLALAFACVAGTASAAIGEIAAEADVRPTSELQLSGLARADQSFTVFVRLHREKPQRLTALGETVGPFTLRGIDFAQGFADFAREGAIYRVWLPEAAVKHGREPPRSIKFQPIIEGVTMVGEVNRPATQMQFVGMTIVEAIQAAGGARKSADLKRVKLTRRDARAVLTTTEIDVEAIIANRGKPEVRLALNDHVEVPARKP